MTVSAISQIVYFPLAPLWAFLMIILAVTIIYQADRALGFLEHYDTVVNAAATANPSVVTRPAVRPASLVASGIIESISITISAPAAKPLMIALKSPDVAFATA